MNRRPAVSAVITTYNRPAGLVRALSSVAGQGFDDVEVVVVNDAGADVAAVTDAFTDRLPIRLVNLPTNRGLPFARKAGIAAARGWTLAFLDDDDVWLPGHLTTALDAFDGGGADFVYTTCLVAETRHRPGSDLPVRSRHRFDYPFDVQLLAVANPIPVISVLTRPFDPTGTDLDPGTAIQEDWAMWLGLVLGRGWRARHHDVATTVYHRIPADTGSMTGAAAGSAAGFRRFADGHQLLHERWPVTVGSPAGRCRWLLHHMNDLVAQSHSAGKPVSHYYYERSLRVIADAVAGATTGEDAAELIAAAVAPEAAEREELAA